MSVPCSDQELRPTKSKNASLPPGVRAEHCWCGHLAKVKESVDFSDKMGMKFFMCANYNASPPRRASLFSARPPVCFAVASWRNKSPLVLLLMLLFLLQSPPPLCMWYHWIDIEQPAWAVQEIEERGRRAWAQFHEEERAERAAARAKKERERAQAQQARNREVNQKRREEEAARRYAEEQAAKERSEAQRNEYRERAAEAEAAEKRGDKTGKYPRWTQEH